MIRWIALTTAIFLAGCDKPHQASPEGVPAFEVSLATFSDHALIAWHGGGGAHQAIAVQSLDAGLQPGKPVQISDGSQDAYEPDLDPVGDGVLIAWYEKGADNEQTAKLARLDASNRVLWRREVSSPHRDGRNPVVRSFAGEALIAWIEAEPAGSRVVCTQRFDLAGQPRRAPRCSSPASPDTWNLNGAVDAQGSFYVVYDAHTNSKGKEIQLIKSSAAADALVRLTVDDGANSVYPDIAIEAGQVAICWVDSRDETDEVYLFVGELSRLNGSLDMDSERITHRNGSASGAYLSWHGGLLALAWNEAAEGRVDVEFRYFDRTGHALGDMRRLTDGKRRALIPAVRPWQGGFLIAWNDYVGEHGGTGPDIFSTSAAMVEAVK